MTLTQMLILTPYSKIIPSLSKFGYSWLAEGCDGELNLLLAFQNAFDMEQILRVWRVCGVAPLTRAALLNLLFSPVSENDESSDDSGVVLVGCINEFD